MKELPRTIALFGDLFAIMDPGRDQDDEDVLVQINRFIRLNILNVLGVVANLAPSQKRARLAKGTLKQLGQPKITVGFGSGAEQTEDDGLKYQFDVGYLAPTEEVQDGTQLIVDTLKAAAPKTIVLLLISQLTDAAKALREYTHLFESKIRRVVIMGGVLADGDLPKLDAEGRMIPDMTAQNHSFDKESTTYLYRTLQDLQVPITVLSRHSAVAAKVPRSVYEQMSDTGHPVGKRLLNAQRVAIEELWKRACMPADDANRHGLPGRCDKAWFSGAFCGGLASALTPEDSVWPLVQTFNLYDPCTLVAAIPNLREHYFAPRVVEVHGVEHLIIGLTAKEHNVRDPAELAAFLTDTMVESLVASLAECTLRVA